MFRERAAWLAALLAICAAVGLSFEFAAQDVLHLSVRSPVTDWYRIYPDTGAGLPEKEALANTLFPSQDGGPVSRVNFPLSPAAQRFSLSLGEVPGSKIQVARLCIERALLISRCLNGVDLAPYVESASQAEFAAADGVLLVKASGFRPSLIFGPALLNRLRPVRSLPLLLLRAAFVAMAACFFFAFFLALLRPVFAWSTKGALVVFGIALALRLLSVAFVQPGTVSDSDLFLRYFQVHLFSLPGIRGIAYPAFLNLFGGNLTPVFLAQFLLGACGSVIVLLLLRSIKPHSPSDLSWAVLGTSWPTLIGMEAIILAESFCAFLLLAAALIFRWLQLRGLSATGLAGLGAACALLAHTKPQFGFVTLVFAVLLIWPSLWKLQDRFQKARNLAWFVTPILVLQLFALGLNFSYGNYRGTSATLGYSLFDHAQQGVDCPNQSRDPHLQYLCQARAEIGTGAAPYAYTAWVIFPAMHQLHEPFPAVTADYAALSARLILEHPALYARTVSQSFFDFWTARIPMVQGLAITGQRTPSVRKQEVAKFLLGADRYGRDAMVAAFFFAIVTAPVWMRRLERGSAVFLAVLAAVVLCSATLQALVESGAENARFQIPTEPYLTLLVVAALAQQRARYPLLRYFF